VSILKKVGGLLSPNDPELVEKTLARLNEQDTWNDVFSTKLIELLDKIDRIKGEIRERLRRADERIQKAESVAQAESLLLETSAKFGDSSQRLELAQTAERRASARAEEAKDRWEEAAAALSKAQQMSSDATASLGNARQMAADARRLADDANGTYRSAQETLFQATRLSVLTARYATVGMAACWITLAWAGWFMIRTISSFWFAIGLSILIIVAATFALRRSKE
jgi:multidrug efflux pump subunit AcrA (membrane-fusion protein)